MNKTTGIILGVVVIVVVVAAAFMYGGSSSQSVATTTPLPSGTPGDVTGGAFVQQAPSGSPDAMATSPAPSMAASSTTVALGDTAFEPASLTVSAGTTVTFMNNGQATHWPASDPHPTHTGYPGFDAKHGLATGESYSFTFTKVGSWGFHDHLNPRLHGTIVVQ